MSRYVLTYFIKNDEVWKGRILQGLVTVNRLSQASMLVSYHFMCSDLKQQSDLLQQAREIVNRHKLTSSLDELIERGVLSSYNAEERPEGRNIMDV